MAGPLPPAPPHDPSPSFKVEVPCKVERCPGHESWLWHLGLACRTHEATVFGAVNPGEHAPRVAVWLAD